MGMLYVHMCYKHFWCTTAMEQTLFLSNIIDMEL